MNHSAGATRLTTDQGLAVDHFVQGELKGLDLVVPNAVN